nr:MurR/RpiR family transcriptional regulator [Deinobacterium chartae]
MPAGALSRLRSQLDLLTPALQRAARYVQENPHAVLYQTVTELSEASGCGEASVIRMCRDLGFKGFQDFKLALSADLAAAPSPAGPADSTADLVRHALEGARGALEETRKVLDLAALEDVADAVARAPQVLITGQGASGITALDFGYKLLRLGKPAQAHQDPHLAAMTASVLPAGSVVIGITRSGSTVDTVHVLRIAREAGAFTVAVTHRARSPITQYADRVLSTASPESPLTGGAVSSKIGQLLVLEALYLLLARHLEAAGEAVRRTAEAVVEKSY